MGRDKRIGVVAKRDRKALLALRGREDLIEENVKQIVWRSRPRVLLRMVVPLPVLMADAISAFEWAPVALVWQEGVQAEILDGSFFVRESKHGELVHKQLAALPHDLHGVTTLSSPYPIDRRINRLSYQFLGRIAR
jgi:hypothetical protein